MHRQDGHKPQLLYTEHDKGGELYSHHYYFKTKSEYRQRK